MEILKITYKEAITFLLPRHYSGRKPNIVWAFGWFDSGVLKAVCTFGKPASPYLCIGVCGPEYSSQVFELNRLCRIDSLQNPLSSFVAGCLRLLKPKGVIVVSYSDTAMNHHGYIYQACNFLYTGATKQRTDRWTPGNKHSRHYDKGPQGEYRKVRSSKHRYIFFAYASKKMKKKARASLRYPVTQYPKGSNNPNYLLGDFLEPQLVKTPCIPTK